MHPSKQTTKTMQSPTVQMFILGNKKSISATVAYLLCVTGTFDQAVTENIRIYSLRKRISTTTNSKSNNPLL